MIPPFGEDPLKEEVEFYSPVFPNLKDLGYCNITNTKIHK